MRCRNVKSKLSRYLDRELSAEEQGDLERHIAGCGSCREVLARLRAAGAALAQLPAPPEVPEGFAERVIARARREQQPVVVPSWPSLSPAMGLAAAAMLMLGLGLGTLMGRDLTRGDKTRPGLASPDADVVYGFDYFSDAPSGSLANAYATLTSANNGGGR